MGKLHSYSATVVWTGDLGEGTSSYTGYSRDHDVIVDGKPVIAGSADPAFRGDPTRINPEEMLVAALAQCHMLWFLHLAATDGVIVTGYTDSAAGTMRVEAQGHGNFTEVVLRPVVTIASDTRDDGRPITDSDIDALHTAANQHCFIARSVNFTVRHQPAPLVVEQV